jgi:predicted PurR-regulated permease PerM
MNREPSTGPAPGPARRLRSRGERRVTYALKVVLLVAVSAILCSWVLDFVGRVRSVAFVVVGAIFFTYAIFPAVRALRARMPFGAAIAVVYVAIALVLGFGVSVVLPALSSDVQQLVRSYPVFVQHTETALGDPNNPLVARVPGSVRAYVATLPAEFGTLAQRYGGQAASRTLAILLSAVSVVATLVVIPVISAYLMLEAGDLGRAFLGMLPPRSRTKAVAIGRDLDHALGGFIRGQFLVGAIVGACITAVLLLTHVRYAVLIGVLAGLFNIIPFFGSIVAFVPSVSLALFNDGWQHAVLVALLLVGVQQLEGHFIAPNIVSGSVGLSPLMVIVAILIGADLLGILGMFLAVPVAAMLRVLVLHALPGGRPSSPSARAEGARTTGREVATS